ncbi:hypothetical protein GCM10022226_32220 [Sphaerisporangium flaviroseum]|uniref:CU044_5270 family protein n=1 Tax=Sphaerisporangium flaviroseum TaxID=509199 RepID=A0ABP7I4L5_9ACTN
MDDEIELFSTGRPAAPPYPPGAREAARRRLLNAAAGRRRLLWPRPGWQAVGAFGLTLALVGGLGVALSSGSAPVAVPGATTTESVSVAAPPREFADLDPKPGQFLLVESETMSRAESLDQGKQTRYLNRTERKFWKPVDGNGKGLLWIAGLKPKPFPGSTLPENAESWQGGGWNEVDGHCPGSPDDTRTDYVHLSTLPSDQAGMREFIYKQPRGGKQPRGDNGSDVGAFTAVGDLLWENYLPRAQRQAMFEAAKTIPGVEVAEGVQDSAGREGVALGKVRNGVLEQLIFDPDSYLFLGERGTVVDERAGGAPVGSVVALTAQLRISVTDRLPQAENVAEDASCDQSQPATPLPTGTGDDLTKPSADPSKTPPPPVD